MLSINRDEKKDSSLLFLKSRGGKLEASGTRTMEVFLEGISEHEKEFHSSTTSLVDDIRSNPRLVQTILRCHDRFIQVVAAELAVTNMQSTSLKIKSTEVNRIGESHVEIAMKKIGLNNVLLEAKDCGVHIENSSNRRKTSKYRRTKQWTEEQIDEQERLLASSKEKFLRGSD